MSTAHFTAFTKHSLLTARRIDSVVAGALATLAVLFFSSPAQAVKYTKIAAGGDHASAVVLTGRMHCWGDNHYGQLGHGNTVDCTVPVILSSITTATHVSAGNSSTCALLSSGGGGRCWGTNGAGKLGNNSTTGSDTPVTVFRP